MRTLKEKNESKIGVFESGGARAKQSIYDKRKYRVKDVGRAKQISASYLKDIDLNNAIEFGLPEVDDRYHIWRVPLKGRFFVINISPVLIRRASRSESSKSLYEKHVNRWII